MWAVPRLSMIESENATQRNIAIDYRDLSMNGVVKCGMLLLYASG